MYRKDVIDILAQFPDEAKILQAEGDVMQVYNTELYFKLFDHFGSLGRLGTQIPPRSPPRTPRTTPGLHVY